MNWKLYSFIIRSKRRKDIVLALKQPKTPSQLAKDVKASTSHVSRTLKQFSDRGIVICLTPQEKIGKVYELTAIGKDILKAMN